MPDDAAALPVRTPPPVEATIIAEHIVEVVSDSGEGAQKCGQSFASIAARMGIGIWTVEIIPAEIEPPPRTAAGASGNRIRLGSQRITNGGDQADLVVAFNEQALLGRVHAGELKRGALVLLENKWRTDPNPRIAAAWARAHEQLVAGGYRIVEAPFEHETLKHVGDAHRGTNMFVLGVLCRLYSLDLTLAREQVALVFGKKQAAVVEANLRLLEAGHAWAAANLGFRFRIPAAPPREPQIVVSGNVALALGAVASGMRTCAMYPITPATSASHYLSEIFPTVGGLLHQAEDEIAACCFAIGASWAGQCALTITSGPGFSLKQEAMGLAVMGEIPLVVVNVQRGGPSTGLPTKTEQGDLLAACFGGHGDAPKVVLAPATIEECFYAMITARRIAELFNVVVVVLTDASLATAQQPFPRPAFDAEWLAPPLNQNPLPAGTLPYDWDARTGRARRLQPGQPGGMFCLTGLAHDRSGKVVYEPQPNEEGLRHRSLKLAALQKSLKLPPLFGDDHGDLLAIGWGSTKGAIEEAVAQLRADGLKVSALHLQFIQPMPSGLGEVLRRFGKVVTLESNWCDRPGDALIDSDNRRLSSLALLLRARHLVDVDCWCQVTGQPIKPGTIARVLREKLS